MHGRWYSMSQINKDNDPHNMTILHSAFDSTLESMWKIHHQSICICHSPKKRNFGILESIWKTSSNYHTRATRFGIFLGDCYAGNPTSYFSDRKLYGFLIFPYFSHGISHASPLRSFPVVIKICCGKSPKPRLATRRVPFLPALPTGGVGPLEPSSQGPSARVYQSLGFTKVEQKNGPMEQLTKTVKQFGQGRYAGSRQRILFSDWFFF